MSEIRGCNIPEDLYYWPEKHVWVAPQDDGSVVVGVTDVAQSLAHAIISALPKKVGRPAKKGRSLGTIESGKWVGPVTSPVTGEILESNPVLGDNPGIINSDPYGEGWYMKIMPADADADIAELVTGAEGVAAYEAFLEAEEIECG
ncbi:MAG: glycine cleavage system protein GcvH [Actinomycetota bacterium]|nr:glycine cleavage system protein GcvH [Actinomycetota bacterium]